MKPTFCFRTWALYFVHIFQVLEGDMGKGCLIKIFNLDEGVHS